MAYRGRRNKGRVLSGALIAIGVVLLDRVVKLWAAGPLKESGSIPLIKNVFHLTYVENRGAAFSMLAGHRWLLIGIAAVTVTAIIYAFCSRMYAHPLTDISFPLVVGGAIGNLWDRVTLGYVVDLFDFRLINFAVFNVADVAITCAAGLLMLYVVLTAKNG
ncbi:MAG TPA: signal peptidase II [Candidatus Acidoferrum sp.]|nr:signal peptidase II [Candidatus Acidoferrum sp.]